MNVVVPGWTASGPNGGSGVGRWGLPEHTFPSGGLCTAGESMLVEPRIAVKATKTLQSEENVKINNKNIRFSFFSHIKFKLLSLQTFTELQTRYTTTPFVENFGYDDNQFFDGEDPMQ